MKKLLIILLLFGECSICGYSQNEAHNVLKINLNGLQMPQFGLAWERSAGAGRRFELQVGVQWNLARRKPVFVGSSTVTYMVENVDTFGTSGSNGEFYFQNSSGWFYLGELKDLPELPRFVQDRVFYLKIGYRMMLMRESRRLVPFLQPGLYLININGYEVTDNATVIWKRTENEVDVGANYYNRYVRHYELRRQQREIAIRSGSFIGLHYDMGLSFRLNRRLLLETRLVTGLNINVSSKKIDQSGLAARWYWGPALQLGWKI